MKKQLFIITGTTKGIGHAVVRALLAKGHEVYGISRNANPFPAESAYRHLSAGITNVEAIANLFQQIADRALQEPIDAICLVSNAAIVSPLKPIDRSTKEEIEENIATNFSGPILLISNFISRFKGTRTQKQIVNITSDAANQAIPDLSLYCATKAGMARFFECVGKELEGQSDFQLLSIDPGRVDTPMQEFARTRQVEEFRMANRFKAIHESGLLKDVNTVAESIIEQMGSARQK